MPRRLGTIIAERNGTLKLSDRTLKKVQVLVGKPTKRHGEDDYICPFQVRGLADESVRFIVGYDSVQAIELAFSFIGHVIQNSTPSNSEWKDAAENLGFPKRPDVK